MAFRMLVVMVVATAHLTMTMAPPDIYVEPLPQEWPCPIANNILPCVCTAREDYNLTMECSEVQSTSELESIFMEQFPFFHYLEMKIEHDPDDLSNQLDSINAHTFQDVTFERITISGTQLSMVEDEAFSGSHEYLRFLDLSSNQLSAYPFEPLREYTYLYTFILDGNQLIELPDLDSDSIEVFSANDNSNMVVNSRTQFSLAPNLREIHLSGIALGDLTPTMFNLTKLEILDLSRNDLTEVNLLDIATFGRTLSRVDLSDNYINFVDHDSISGLKSDAVLVLQNNQLSTLEEQYWTHIFEQLKDGGILDLSGNPLLCGCDIAWIMLDEENDYIGVITDNTLCQSGEQLIFLETDYFVEQC